LTHNTFLGQPLLPPPKEGGSNGFFRRQKNLAYCLRLRNASVMVSSSSRRHWGLAGAELVPDWPGSPLATGVWLWVLSDT